MVCIVYNLRDSLHKYTRNLFKTSLPNNFRKGGLLWINILAALGAGLMLGAKYSGSFEMLLAGRLVIGINSGVNAGISPMYLTELCPASLRGAVSHTWCS